MGGFYPKVRKREAESYQQHRCWLGMRQHPQASWDRGIYLEDNHRQICCGFGFFSLLFDGEYCWNQLKGGKLWSCFRGARKKLLWILAQTKSLKGLCAWCSHQRQWPSPLHTPHLEEMCMGNTALISSQGGWRAEKLKVATPVWAAPCRICSA